MRNILLGLGSPSIRLEFANNGELADYLTRLGPEAMKAYGPSVRFAQNESVSRYAARPAAQDTERFVPASLPESPVSDVKLYDVADLATDHALFQNRKAAYSEESVNHIVSDVKAGRFRWAALDPVIVWQGSDGRRYVLSGHSRQEAFRRLAAEGVQVDGRGFDKIPGREFVGTQEEAKELAKTSNSLSTKETEIERAAFYRAMLKAGRTRREVEAEARRLEGRNANFILNLSALSERGAAWQALEAFEVGQEGENVRRIKDMADWIGEARRRWPELSDSHEGEMWAWLQVVYQRPITSRREWLERLDLVLSRLKLTGGLDQPLNLFDRAGKSPAELEYDEEVRLVKKELDDLDKAIKEQRKEGLKAGLTPQKVAQYTQEKEMQARTLQKRLIELIESKGTVRAAARAQMSLFGLGRVSGSILPVLLGVEAHVGLGRLQKEVTYVVPEEHVALGSTSDILTFGKDVKAEFPEIKVAFRKQRIHETKPIRASEDVAMVLKMIVPEKEIEFREHFIVLYLDTQSKLMGYYRAGVGAKNAVLADVGQIVAVGLVSNATSIILCHNHPSGNLRPSDADIRMTKQLVEACKLFEMRVFDHIIITKEGHFSFADKGLM